jgi:hypothetical protein
MEHTTPFFGDVDKRARTALLKLIALKNR